MGEESWSHKRSKALKIDTNTKLTKEVSALKKKESC